MTQTSKIMRATVAALIMSIGLMNAALAALTNVLQADGVGKNKAPYLVYRFRPLAPGIPGF